MTEPDKQEGELTILLVEDDDVAAEGVARSARKFSFPCNLVWARDGLEALQVLRGHDGKQPLSSPLIVLLDLNMPRMDGFEFLEQLRADPTLQHTVVFVLTTSNSEADIRLAYVHVVAGYLVKSQLGRGMEKLGAFLSAYQAVTQLPRHQAHGC